MARIRDIRLIPLAYHMPRIKAYGMARRLVASRGATLVFDVRGPKLGGDVLATRRQVDRGKPSSVHIEVEERPPASRATSHRPVAHCSASVEPWRPKVSHARLVQQRASKRGPSETRRPAALGFNAGASSGPVTPAAPRL
jgi:hypothetical protein